MSPETLTHIKRLWHRTLVGEAELRTAISESGSQIVLGTVEEDEGQALTAWLETVRDQALRVSKLASDALDLLDDPEAVPEPDEDALRGALDAHQANARRLPISPRSDPPTGTDAHTVATYALYVGMPLTDEVLMAAKRLLGVDGTSSTIRTPTGTYESGVAEEQERIANLVVAFRDEEAIVPCYDEMQCPSDPEPCTTLDRLLAAIEAGTPTEGEDPVLDRECEKCAVPFYQCDCGYAEPSTEGENP